LERICASSWLLTTNYQEPEDGLKWAETCSCGIYVHFVRKLCCVLTANYTLLLIHRTQRGCHT